MLIQRVKFLVTVWQAPLLRQVFRHQNLARIDALKGGKQIFRLGLGGEYELTGGQVESSGIQALLPYRQGQQEVVALGVDLTVCQSCRA